MADKQTSRAYFYYTCCSSPLLMRLRVCRFSSRPGRWISGLFQCLPDGEILEQDLHPAAADSANGHRGGADPAYEQWHRKSSPGRLPAHHCQVLSAAQCALQFHRLPKLHRQLWTDGGPGGECRKRGHSSSAGMVGWVVWHGLISAFVSSKEALMFISI